MRIRWTSLSAYAAVAWLGCLIGLLPGCALAPWNSFLDPTAVGQFPLKYKEGGIRRVLTPREAPPGLATASEPTPEDLVPLYEDYRIGPNDQVAVVINDLIAPGVPEQGMYEVSPTGYVRLAILGSIKITGMTEQEVEQELKARLIDDGLLPDPIIRVVVQTPRQRFFTILGAVNAQAAFPITQPDLRLLDALALARGISPVTKTLYVIRREEPSSPETTPWPTEEPTPEKEFIIPPPMEEDQEDPSLSFFAGLGFPPQEAPASQSQPTQELEELETIIAPPGQASQPATRPQEPERQRPFAPLVFDPVTGEPRELRPEEQVPPPPAEVPTQVPVERPQFEWEDVPEYELAQRVIEIDVKALKAGDPRYNIIIRDRDAIQVPMDTGVFYLMGEVNRPGVYAFSDREITVKQAIATAAGFSVMAWPQRCEIIRREPGTDTQITIPVNLDAIFAGLEDDVLLRDEDILNVGTHFVAPFLFIARNSFRFTYGFGFVYDRNFADKDSYSVKINPQTLKMQEQQRRGLPF